jgi:hypothetical protein
MTIGRTEVRVIRGNQGNEDITFRGSSADYVDLDSGNNSLRMTGDESIRVVTRSDGTNEITLEDTTRVLTMKLDRSDNRLTTEDGNIESLYSFESNNTFNIGDGGIQQIVMSGNVGNQHTISSTGFIGSLQVYGDATTNLTLLGNESFAGLIRTGAGNDVIKTAGDDIIDFAGARSLAALTFTQQGDDVLVRFQKSSVVVQDITVADLQQADNFGF